jgi:competence protein ComEC
MSRPMLLLATAIAIGAFVGDELSAADAGRLLSLGGLLLVLALRAGARASTAALAAGALAIGAAAAATERLTYDRAPLRALVAADAGSPVARVIGIARDDGRVQSDRLVLTLDVETVVVDDGRARAARGRVRLHVGGAGPFPEVRAGDRVAAWAELRAPGGFRNPGSVDLAGLARLQGVHAAASCKSVRLIEVGAGPPLGLWERAARSTRRWAHQALTHALPEGPERGVVLAMTLGEQSAVDPDTAEAFRVAGTYHVLALSGAQVALVAAVLLFAFRGSGVGTVGQAVIVTPAMAFYAALVGEGVSIIRAAAMALLAVWGRALDAEVDLANVLGSAAAVLLLDQPSLVTDVGFELTFAATLGILLLTPVIEGWLPRAPFALSRLAAASLAAQIALTPIMAGRFHRLAPAALLLNLVAVPLSSAVLLSGAGVLAAAALSVRLATYVSPVAWITAHLLLMSGNLVKDIPALDLRVPGPGMAEIVLYSAGTAMLLRRRPGAGAALIVAAVVRLCWPAPCADGRLHVTALDVGQGDALVVETPSGRAWVIDAGGAADGFDLGELVVAPYLWSRGITTLDGVAVSHAHLDHAGGVPFLLRHFAPRELWEGPAPTADAGYRMLDAAAGRAGVTRRTVVRGTSRVIDGVRFEVVGPSPPRGTSPQTRNDDSVVIRVSMGEVSFLLTGDIESAGEQALRSGPATVLKVPHHGSRTSSSSRFLEAAAPHIAILSVGARNHFGHPSPEVLQRYAERGILVCRTDHDGAVTVSTDGQRLWIETFGGDPTPRAGI